MKIILGLFVVAMGAVLILKTQWFVENFGTNAWAEEKFGYSGGTRLMYKMLGLIFIFVGFLLVTNMWQGFLMGTVGRLFIRQ